MCSSIIEHMSDTRGAVILGRKPAERSATRVPIRLSFDALAGPSGAELAKQAAKVAQMLLPPPDEPWLLGPSGAPLTQPEPSGACAGDGASAERLEADSPPVWAGMAPGAELADILGGVSPRALDTDDLVRLAQAHTRMISHYEARQAEAIAALTRRSAYDRCSNNAEAEHDRLKAAADEVSAALRWTPSYADRRVHAAVELAAELPATLSALSAGKIDGYRAQVIVDETAPLRDDPEARAKVEADVLRAAGNKTGPALRARVKKAVAEASPDVVEERRRTAREGRRVDRPFPECDGMGSMALYGPLDDLAALYAAVDAAARDRRDRARRSGAGEDYPDAKLSLDELRFDVMADLGWVALAAGHLGCCADDCAGRKQRLGTQQGRRAQVNVTVPLSTLLGIDDTPGELHGYGPISAEVARRIAGDATLRRMLTDPATGALLDFGTTRYAPPAHLREFVAARDRTCRFPSCTRTAESSQLDHTVPHRPDGSGGPTADYNLGAFHDRHHNAKTSHGWRFEQPQPGQFVITSPAGLRYESEPEQVGPIIEPASDANGVSEQGHSGGADPPERHASGRDHSPGSDSPDDAPTF
jgi:hypothetical protein